MGSNEKLSDHNREQNYLATSLGCLKHCRTHHMQLKIADASMGQEKIHSGMSELSRRFP